MQRGRRRQLGTLLQFGRGALWACTGLLGFACLVVAVFGGRHGDWMPVLYVAGTFLGLWFARRYASWRPALLLAFQLALLAGLVAWFSRGPDVEELPAEGDRLLEAMEAHRREHGRYPRSLSEAGCVPEWNAFGGWQYESPGNGITYHIWVGEYMRDNFVLYRRAEDECWQWDT